MKKSAESPISSRKRERDDSWDPRLARSCSYCVKRLFQRTFMCLPSGESKEEAKEEIKTPKKPPRPLNSYLKVVLDDDTMDRLHEISVKLGEDIQAMSQEEVEQDGETEATTARKRKGRPLKFRWRSRTSLHFTFFFGGEVLCAMSPEELMSWHASVNERLGKSRFFLDADPLVEPDPQRIIQESPKEPLGPEELKKEEYWFRIKELSLFPPRRNPYLIVAILEASPAWHALYHDIRDVALNADSEGLRALAGGDKGGDWIPHITLGNLYGGNKADKDTVRAMLQEFPLDASLQGGEIGVKCISMGGPAPQQVELDWNFQVTHK